jgi:hypothetical protein
MQQGHLSDDIVRRMEAGGLKSLTGVLILVVRPYSTRIAIRVESSWGDPPQNSVTDLRIRSCSS